MDTTKELNARLEIVNLKGYRFNTPKGICTMRGFAFYIKGKGFVRFKHDLPGIPYAPCGGRKALLSILNSGGFVNYDSLEFTNPISEN